jgi:hypothetical protein
VARPVGPVRVWLGYTLVSNLMYRTNERTETLYDGVNLARGRTGTGLARNYSDYDELTLRVSAVPLAGVVLSPELTLLRQGEGDFRLPFPAVADYPNTPTMFAGVRERVWRAALAGTIEVHHVTLEGNAGVHRRSNAGHVPGVTVTEFVGGVVVRLGMGGVWGVD